MPEQPSTYVSRTPGAPDASDGLYLGVMSGTSLDGADAVLAEIGAAGIRLIGHCHREFAPPLRDALLALQASGHDELHRAAVASRELAQAYAQVIAALLGALGIEAAQVRAAGVHGQTVRHRPDAGYTIQLNAPALLAELCGVDIVADFRSRDIAAGGQGAPLVPAFHAYAFGGSEPRAVINIGGIANLTGLPGGASTDGVIGFDCGPGNVLIDAWAQRHLGIPRDSDGAWAASGRVDAQLLARLLAEPYFERAPPKSTGRDLFNLQWLDRRLDGPGAIRPAPADVQATLTRLTARTIGAAMRRHWPQARDVVVCGGGAFNACLMEALGEECAPLPVRSSAARGIAPDHVEALAFAWLAREHRAGRGANLPAVTGAHGRRTLGALYPR
jgi:anhydro-N-acetylmuramic acid kinase